MSERASELTIETERVRELYKERKRGNGGNRYMQFLCTRKEIRPRKEGLQINATGYIYPYIDTYIHRHIHTYIKRDSPMFHSCIRKFPFKY